jgi:HEAT repeat protein
MDRVYRVLKIQPGEARTASRFLAFMVVVWTGFAVGGSAVEALLFARFGPQALPYLYIGLGVFTFVSMTGMSVLLQRRDPERILVFLPLAFAAVVLIMRVLVEPGLKSVYPVLWLLMMVMWTAQGVAVWGLASTLHDTRQAKRLFPVYGAGWILGIVVGGFVTRPLALWIHAENLLLVWAVSLVAAFLIARGLMGSRGTRGGRRRRSRSSKSRPAGPLQELRETFRFVRASRLLRWMAVSLALFALLFFVLTLVFAEAVTARFPIADRLAGFLGLLGGMSNGIGFLTALFLANRLFARFGLASMVLTLPLIYVAGFAVLTFSAAFLAVVAFRFIQVVWMNGVWASAWQGLFNVVPAERRHRVRTFMDGVPLQVGVVAAGVLLILAERTLAPSQIALVGVGAAALASVAMWRARAAYGAAVVEALRAGNPEVFFVEEEPFGGFRRDAAAASALLEGASDPDPAIRRISMEILAETSDAATNDVLAGGLGDIDAAVRIAALRGVARSREASVLPEVLPLLGDPEPGVRAGAVDAVVACSPAGVDLRPDLGPLLSDPDPHVRGRAAGALLRLSDDAVARVILNEMAASPAPDWRATAVAILGELGEELGTVTIRLADRDAAVRRAAASALRGFDLQSSTGPLLEALGDADPTVRDAAVETAVRFGTRLAGPLLEALSVPAREAGALLALVRLPGVEPAAALRSYAMEQVTRAVHYQDLWQRLDPDGNDRLGLVCYSLKNKAIEHGVNALRSMPRDTASVDLAIENLASRDPVQRANALETLEAMGEPEIVRPLLAVWEGSPEPATDPGAVLVELLTDPDPWLRACAAFALTSSRDGRVGPVLEQMARTDPDPTARQAASSSLKGDRAMETLSKLPLMERVLFLRKVRLFDELTPMDLKHVAAGATEHLFPDGELIAEQGELGNEMHIVVSGEIRVVLGVEREQQAEVARRRPGDCVGEMAILSEEPRMASLVADGDVRTLSLDRTRFQRILKERPEASLAVMRVLCERLRESHARDPGNVAV